MLAFPRLWRGDVYALLACLCLALWAAFLSLLGWHPPARVTEDVLCEFTALLAVGTLITSCVAIDQRFPRTRRGANVLAAALQYTCLALCMTLAVLSLLNVYNNILVG